MGCSDSEASEQYRYEKLVQNWEMSTQTETCISKENGISSVCKSTGH